MEMVDIIAYIEWDGGFEFILFLGRRNACHFLVLQMATELECKATEAISPAVPESPRTDQSLGGSASSVRRLLCLFSV